MKVQHKVRRLNIKKVAIILPPKTHESIKWGYKVKNKKDAFDNDAIAGILRYTKNIDVSTIDLN